MAGTRALVFELEQGAELAASDSAVFGLRRQPWARAETAPSPARGAPVPVKGLSPRVAWPQRCEIPIVKGGWPDFDHPQGKPADSPSEPWIRDRPPRIPDGLALAASCDAFPPALLPPPPARHASRHGDAVSRTGTCASLWRRRAFGRIVEVINSGRVHER